MKLNSKVNFPDPTVIYNFTLLEQHFTKSSTEIGIKSLLKLKESPERNLYIFVLRLKENEYFNQDFFKNRQFSSNFIHNETEQNLLEICYDFMVNNPDKLSARTQLQAIMEIDRFGDLVSEYACSKFVCCLYAEEERLLFCLWRFGEEEHYNFKKLNVKKFP